MKIAYFDCFAGASGDMILGAMVDAGLRPDRLNHELEKLHLGLPVNFAPSVRKGISGTQAIVDCHTAQNPPHRHLGDIVQLIDRSELSPDIKEKSIAIFNRLAIAEARVHGTVVEAVHFHEVGAMDAIIDIVGAVAGLSLMGIDAVHCSAIHVGSGTIVCNHGLLPVPAPAVLELVKGIPVYSTGVKGELLTPTGAAILTTLAETFGPLPEMTVEASGYGTGASDPEIPNLLRLIVGHVPSRLLDAETDRVGILEAAVDDMNPQVYDFVMQQALSLGARDIFLTPIQMKKNRPGTLVTLMCLPEDIDRFARFLLRETTSIGLRWRIEHRIKAGRDVHEFETSLGTVRVKTATFQNATINLAPEYDDCKAIALQHNLPLKSVMDRICREISSPDR